MESIGSTIATLIRADLLNQDGVVKAISRPFATVYSEGSPADSVLFLESGLVKLCRQDVDGNELILQIITPGELFGELALSTQQTRVADAQVLHESAIYTVPRGVL